MSGWYLYYSEFAKLLKTSSLGGALGDWRVLSTEQKLLGRSRRSTPSIR